MDSSEIFSFRIISADHYMCHPITNVDLCYSEFRGNEIKSVPVIRIFGVNSSGEKICANIHGVFPYLYIGCSDSKPDVINQMTYQIAASLDKAINISLGQTNSTAQHVFKVSLVKGIPFYGYHRSMHQFFKVYLYNPHFVKRAANLFQNSIILGKMMQPHDSHIPYLLKFFIDYNLYGMSWLHVPKQNINFRGNDSKLKKRSVSEYEIDFNAINILNRFLINVNDSNKAANPGIESIWEDERTRRKNLEIEIPLEIPPSQPRANLFETESDVYFKRALNAKVLMAADDTIDMSGSGNLTLSNESTLSRSQPKKKFNLKTIIENIDYPAEISQTNCSQNNFNLSQGTSDSQLDKTIEEMEHQILNFTQNLAEVEDENEDDQNVENDSILGPLSQSQPKNPEALSQSILQIAEVDEENEIVPGNIDNNDWDSEDEIFNDINVTIQDLEAFSQFQVEEDDEEKIPQLDGIDDAPRKYNLRRKATEVSASLDRQQQQVKKQCRISMKKMEIADDLIEEYQKRYSKVAVEESPIDLATKYDLEHGFIPEAGPSRISNFPATILSPIPSSLKRIIPNISPIPNSLTQNCNESSPCQDLFASSPVPSSTTSSQNPMNLSILNDSAVQSRLMNFVQSIAKNTAIENENGNNLDDSVIHSFYENTFLNENTDKDEDLHLSDADSIDTSYLFEKTLKRENGMEIIITPKILPPDPEEIADEAKKYFENTIPYYGNPNDLTEKKEVGHTILQLMSNRLNDCESFQSEIFSENQLNKFQKDKLRRNFNVSDDHFGNILRVKEFLSSDKMVVIEPFKDPPSQRDARNWLKASEMYKEQNADNESPIKIKREKILMCLEQEQEPQNEDVINSSINNESICGSGKIVRTSDSVILSSQEKLELNTSSTTPQNASHLSYSARRRSRKLVKSFRKRFNSIIKSRIMDEMRKTPTPLSQSSNPDTQSGSSDDSVLRLMEDSVFIKNANNLDETNFYNSCEITTATLDNTGGFKMKLENLQTTRSSTECSFLTILSVEIHMQTRKELRPDPEIDPISAIFYVVENDVPDDHSTPKLVKGIIAYNNNFTLKFIKNNVDIFLVNNEMELFDVFLKQVEKWDPDIFAGYEIEMASWGYIVQRGFVLGMNLMNKLSRVPWDKEKVMKKPETVEDEEPGDRGDYNSEMKIPGRIMLDVWRLLRHEIALTAYTFENTMYHILHRRYPKHSFGHLTTLWEKSQMMWIVLDYYMDRAYGTIELLKQLDLIGRTCELAKLFGIQFYEVLSRGSQFRVESMMMRIAKPRNYVPVSPSVQQRAHMRAPEYLPLILEPQSRFYADPVIVLDFQSLYPSMIIAYNYCFSTCLGRVEYLGQSNQPFEFGVSQLRIPPKNLKSDFLDQNRLTVSPCGVAFVKRDVREGVLPRMLKEILDTRLMVKSSMKIHKSDSALQRVLHSRQLGLKLIANVTYGYTAANFSGRMPCIEVGDSVVSKGRETLERAIKMVEENEKWGCKVVYGDTDSLFVLVPGRTKEEAFQIGEEIAKKVTDENPPPVKLKLEKVYQPCILQTKKRYVGFMYETADQKEPIYEAKGIETVRRDGCPAVAKILEKSLRILFESCDVSKVKGYVCRQFTKILTGRSNLMDLIFAKEFRGINGYKERACVPSLMMTRRWKLADPRNEPRRGERVPFVIVNGAPGLPLIRLVRYPLEVLNDDNYKMNAIYYITKVIIPALNRCFLLIGANVHDWFAELPRKQQFIPMLLKQGTLAVNGKQKSTISQYFSSKSCATDCGQQSNGEAGICTNCRKNPQKTVTILSEKIFKLERKVNSIQKICESCCRRSFETECISLDCPVLYVLKRVKSESRQTEFYRQILDKF